MVHGDVVLAPTMASVKSELSDTVDLRLYQRVRCLTSYAHSVALLLSVANHGIKTIDPENDFETAQPTLGLEPVDRDSNSAGTHIGT